MEMAEQFSGNFVDASHLLMRGQTEVEVTIAEVLPPNTVQDAKGKQIDEPVIKFVETPRQFILGSNINKKVLSMKFQSTDTKDWLGLKITLVVRVLKEAFGQPNVPCLRVKCDPDSLTFGMRRHYGVAYVPK